MIARISSTLLLAACALWPSALPAQWMPEGQPPTMGYAPPSGQIQLPQGTGPEPGLDYYGDGSELATAGYTPAPLPWERDGDSPVRQFLREVMPNTYFQVEYLSWSIDDIGAGGVGSDTLIAQDLRRPIPFGIFDIDTFIGQDFRAADTEGITFNKLSGGRFTFGVPLTTGTFEVSAFGLEEGDAGTLNSVPSAAGIRPFTVPSNTVLTVPVGVTDLTFPVDVVTSGLPGQAPRVIFSPPAIDPMNPATPTVVLGIAPGSLILGNVVFNAATTSAAFIPLLQNGRPGQTALVYDLGYSSSYHNELWGAETKVVLNMGPDQYGLTMKPLVGFRYMSFDEEFQQVGVSSLGSNILRNGNILFVSSTGTFLPINQQGVIRGPAFTSTIESEVENTLYGLQVGTRTEINHKWFTLGAEPRISLGVNDYQAEVTTRNLRSPNDGVVRTRDEDFLFAPIFDVNMYGRLHVNPYFSLYAGYNFMYLFRVSRADDNIYYNDNGSSARPGIVVNSETQDMHVQGLNIGGEIRFRDLKFRR